MTKENREEMLNAKRPHFFEVFLPNLSSERLKIPLRFIKHMEGRTSGLVSLTGPSGNAWHVDLIQHNDDLFFHEGWPAFVRDHFIECGDSLVFRYDGNLHFTVQVFDGSSCEKEAAFSAKCSQDPSNFDKHMEKKREREKAAVSSDKIFEGVPKKMRGSFSQVHLDKEGCQCEEVTTTETYQEAVFSNETKKCGSPKNSVTIAVPSQSKAFSENPVLEIISLDFDLLDTFKHLPFPKSNEFLNFITEASIQNRTSIEDDLGSHARCCMSTSSRREEKRLAQSFTSCFPNFLRIMKKFNISGSYTLKIPYQFSMAHLPKCKIQIVLRNLKGECWTVNSVPTTKVQTFHTFCGGWMAFVRSNDIKMGDICIFELVRKCELRVRIVAVGKEGLDCQSGKAASNGLTIECAATSHKTSKGLPKKMRRISPKGQLECIAKVESDKKGSDREEVVLTKSRQEAAFSNDGKKHDSASKSSVSFASFSQSEACNEKPVAAIQNRTSIEDKKGSNARGCMLMTFAHGEERAAQSFTSGFPNFVRIMKKFNISGSYTLKIPYQFSMAHLPKCKTEIVLRNLKGECWTVNSVPDSKGRTMHTFCGGWMAFVRGNDVKMGDICIFELVGKCEMRVHISGVGKKGLDCESGKATSNGLTSASPTGNHNFL